MFVYEVLFFVLCSSGLPRMARVSWAVSMLLLLMLCSPGGSSVPLKHLCGSHLVDTLYFVCGERGFFYNPSRTHKRDVEHLLGKTTVLLLFFFDLCKISSNCPLDGGSSERNSMTSPQDPSGALCV